MKKALIALSLALYALVSFGTTLNPIQLLNPTGSSSGQAIVSTGASSAPAWASVNAALLSGNAIGTSGAAVPLLNAANTWSATQTYSSGVTVSGGTLTGFPGRLINVRVFLATGTYTPTAGTNSIIVELQAPSGGSGGNAATAAGQNAASSGGGSGNYARVYVTSGFSGVTVTIGAAGAAGTAGGAGGTGGTTSFGSIVSCPGGNGGPAGTALSALGQSSAGAAQSGSACTISGATQISTYGGGGTGPGSVFAVGGFVVASGGANSLFGQGGNPSGGTSCNSGTGAGAGPSGLISLASTAAVVGCAGRPAIVIVYEFS
ncbi:hypothetical protein PQR52_01555 [Paraburkholderia aspalathi]|uniref:hypothetical protein n=1 Tax=Paraburkholderia aspalathi TaxID=1324617 RepID=UPI0038B8066A